MCHETGCSAHAPSKVNGRKKPSLNMYVLYISAGQMLKGKNSVMEIHKKESRPLEKSGATACEKILSVNKKIYCSRGIWP